MRKMNEPWLGGDSRVSKSAPAALEKAIDLRGRAIAELRKVLSERDGLVDLIAKAARQRLRCQDCDATTPALAAPASGQCPECGGLLVRDDAGTPDADAGDVDDPDMSTSERQRRGVAASAATVVNDDDDPDGETTKIGWTPEAREAAAEARRRNAADRERTNTPGAVVHDSATEWLAATNPRLRAKTRGSNRLM
jgi:hypothetical protein